ncbi:cytochrome P450 [Kutzneria buriramensis]|uniref:Cytochrome P450 n=1 Tax=Kutzneria buriramensis TaxID=1045776 RepID=A0A3E0HPB5_9PSEU|nr:cytochrome P450 [Kutzneria buriramensis]REH48269.1 cytochrome P450 [Kutzneria buriramensis]
MTRPFPFRAAHRLDLDPEFRDLRRTDPLLRVELPYGGDGWLAIGHETVRAILGDPRFSRAAVLGADVPRPQPVIARAKTILTMDPPEHTRLRRLAARAFTSRRMDEFRPRVQAIVDDLLDRLIDAGPPAELIEGLALPLPITVICELLGVPFEDRNRFRAWSERVVSITAYPAEEIEAAGAALKAYLAELVDVRRVEPTDDLLGVLAQVDHEGAELERDELVNFGVTLLVAGHESTANQIGNFAHTLLTRADQRELLLADPGLVPSAVEEMLRYVPIQTSAGGPRVALEDIRIGDVLVRKGETVLPQLASANRDELVFDDPERLDVTRGRNPHLAFGHGVHFCIAAQLARIELQVAIGTLLRRLPTVRLAVPEEELPWKTGMLVRGLRALPVTW